MKAVRLVIASNGVPYLQMALIGSYITSGKEMVGKNKRMVRWGRFRAGNKCNEKVTTEFTHFINYRLSFLNGIFGITLFEV